jgi:cysteine desulfurase
MRGNQYGAHPFTAQPERTGESIVMNQLQKDIIYLDHNATTPISEPVVEAMRPHMEGEFGNPSSVYSLGARAKKAVDEARIEVGALLGCKPSEVTFTSGGSESNNTILKGVVDWNRPQDFHIITSAVEHPAVLNPCLYLMGLGVNVTVLPVDQFGRVDPDDVFRAIGPKTVLISIMLANNEVGTIEPIKELAATAREKEVLIHTDAAQAVGKIPVQVEELGVDFLSLAGHKMYGPKGVGALYIRRDRKVTPLIHGAGQESGRRAGTENVILAVGLGAASKMARGQLKEDMNHALRLRDQLQEILLKGIDGLVIHGHPHERLPNTLSISVPELDGNQILEGLPHLCASTGAACHDRSVELSHVLSAMGVPRGIGMGTLRLTVGRGNTMEQVEEGAESIIRRVKNLSR